MSKLYNLARMSTATTGTGTITLGSAVSGYLTFALAGVSNGETVSYGIKDGSNSEIGTGVYTSSGTTLTRSVTKSTNSDAAISLSGTAEVYITVRAEDLRTLPTTQSLTSGSSATYNTPTGCTWIEVFMVGGGGGGAGASNGTGGASAAGSAGGTSTFNGVNAVGGSGATGTSTITQGSIGGAGGSGGTGTATRRGRGGPGAGGGSVIASNPVGYTQGGHGGNSYFAGGAQVASGVTTQNGNSADANSGAGGAGATGLGNSNAFVGGGGGAGEFVYLLINNPSASYTYTIGSAGAGGVGANATGGAGGSGFIFVIEHYGS